MEFRFSLADEAFRLEFRHWLATNVPLYQLTLDDTALRDTERLSVLKAFQRALYTAGFLGVHWPADYGGQGHGIERQVIFHEEMARAHAPALVGAAGVELIGPTMMADASEAMKRRYLPKMLSAEEIWCQGYSEPNAGSDLAALETRADLDGDCFVINGSKIWTSGAHYADFCALLCRTDQAAQKHRGISYLVVDLTSTGVRIQPIRQMNGGREFCQVFFEDVRVPRQNLIGELNRGWYLVQNTLGFERGPVQLAQYLGYRRNFDEAFGLAGALRGGSVARENPVIRQHLAAAYIDLEIMRLNGYRMLTNLLRGQVPGAEVSPAKIHWGLADQRLHDLAMLVEGPFAQLSGASPHHLGTGHLQTDYLYSRAGTIYGGTAQIQRNIIAERLLSMPRAVAGKVDRVS